MGRSVSGGVQEVKQNWGGSERGGGRFGDQIGNYGLDSKIRNSASSQGHC